MLPLEFCAEKRGQIDFLFCKTKNEVENIIFYDVTIIINVASILLDLSIQIIMGGEREHSDNAFSRFCLFNCFLLIGGWRGRERGAAG